MHHVCTRCAQAVHRLGASAGLALILAGCGGAVPSSGDLAIPFRNPTAPIGVTSRYEDARFAGSWHVRGAYPLDDALRRVERLGDGSTWALEMRRCAPGGACTTEVTRWVAEVDVPGADTFRDPAGGPARRAVIVWVDDGFRTAAVGDADGRFAWVLDRAPTGGADRIAAARRVLEFSGFDLREMRMRPQCARS